VEILTTAHASNAADKPDMVALICLVRHEKFRKIRVLKSISPLIYCAVCCESALERASGRSGTLCVVLKFNFDKRSWAIEVTWKGRHRLLTGNPLVPCMSCRRLSRFVDNLHTLALVRSLSQCQGPTALAETRRNSVAYVSMAWVPNGSLAVSFHRASARVQSE
jgi:hypothetical protein